MSGHNARARMSAKTDYALRVAIEPAEGIPLRFLDSVLGDRRNDQGSPNLKTVPGTVFKLRRI